MDAWETLISGSTLLAGDAWEHLNAQGGGEPEGYVLVDTMEIEMVAEQIDVEILDEVIDIDLVDDPIEVEIEDNAIDVEVD